MLNIFPLILFLASLPIPCTAPSGQQPSTYFVVPPDAGTNAFYGENPVFGLYVDTKLRWVTNEPYYSIFLYQQRSLSTAATGNPIYSKLSAS